MFCFLIAGCATSKSPLPSLPQSTISKEEKTIPTPEKTISSIPEKNVSQKLRPASPSVSPERQADRPAKKKVSVFEKTHKSFPSIPIVINDRVEAFINYYTKNPNGRLWFQRVLIRAQQYKPLMEKILLKAGLPQEVFYLAFVESGFNNHAYSYAHACGPWQFIASTATHYGLKIDYWVDERKDPELATKAAANYLKELHNQFKDWYLTAAAYNAGNGTIQKLIKRYKVRDYWSLIKKARELKLETKQYVPKWIATIIIARNPKAYGFEIKPKDPWDCDKVHTYGLTDIILLSKEANIELNTLKRLNPALKRPFTPPYPYFLHIPKGKKEIVLASLGAQAEISQVFKHFRYYKVKPGDTLWEIARKNRKSVDFIARLNGISPPYILQPKQKLLIPYGEPQTSIYTQRDKKTGRYKIIYTVKSGDTLWNIARLFDTSVKKLKKINKIKGCIYPGDQLLIPLPQKIIIYEVKHGDTLWDIARKFKTTPEEIILLNRLSSSLIRPGDKLKIKIEG